MVLHEKLNLLQAEREKVLKELAEVSPNNKYLFFDFTSLSKSDLQMRNDAMHVMYLPKITLGLRLTIEQEITLCEELLKDLKAALSVARVVRQPH